MTRGSFGEMTGAPDIARHLERVLKDGSLLAYTSTSTSTSTSR